MSKIITDPKEIEPITKKILEKMGESGLERKASGIQIVPDDKYCLFPNTRTRNGFPSSGVTLNLVSEDDQLKLVLIVMRQAPFKILFQVYMHELGHLANMDYINNLGLPEYRSHVYSETLASAFQGYAQEKYNEIEEGYFEDVLNKNKIKARIDSELQRELLDDIHKEAYKLLNSIFSEAHPQYPGSPCETYEEAYKLLRRPLPASVMEGRPNGTIPHQQQKQSGTTKPQ